MADKFKTKRKVSLITWVIIILILAFLLTLILGLIEMEIISNPFIKNNNLKAEKSFIIPDICSIIAGKIIHSVDREEDCQTKCVAACEVSKLRYDNIIFERKNNSCNDCNCNCK